MALTRYKQSCSDRAAYTLVEIAVVVTIIGILATLAVPYFKRVKESAIISTLENDLRIFSQEFMQYELNFGTYPDTSTPGTYPNGMADRISSTWIQSSVIGGTYRWVHASNNGNGGNGGNGNGNGNGTATVIMGIATTATATATAVAVAVAIYMRISKSPPTRANRYVSTQLAYPKLTVI